MSRILIKGGHVFDPRNEFDEISDILISDSYIEKIAPNIQDSSAEEYNAEGLTIIPGMCDMHVHLREPGYEYKEDIASGTAAAAKGGFCFVACMPNTNPVNDNPAVTHSINSICNESAKVNVLPIGSVTLGQKGKMITEMGMMKDAGCVAFSDDGHPVESSRMMYLALEYAKNFDTLIISHCEDPTLKGDMNEGGVSTLLGLEGIPTSSEAIMAGRDILLAEYLNTKVHIAHISAKETVELIRNAKKRGVRVTCETTPHYIAGTHEMVIGYDTNTKVNPPLRSESDRLAIIEGIKDGTIDCIVTDHAPHHLDDKRVEYSLASNGISGLETSFSLCYTHLVKEGHIDLDRLIDLMSYKPLEVLQWESAGISEKGMANLTIVDLNKEYSIDPAKFVSKGKNNPFGGKKVAGNVEGTIVNGEIAYWNK